MKKQKDSWIRQLMHLAAVSPDIAGEIINSTQRIWQLIQNQPQSQINQPLHYHKKQEDQQ